ncbi:hypothetical protein D9M69_487840 [compost metagenome]
MHQHLHVGVHLLALGLVGLAAGGQQQLVELLVLPTRFVHARVGLEEQAEQQIRGRPRTDVAEAQRVLHPMVGPVSVRRHSLNIELEADLLARELQQLGDIHRAGRGF